MTTREELEALKVSEIKERFGLEAPPFTRKADLIDQVLEQVKESRPLPRIEIRSADIGSSLIYTPVGGGKWHVETTGNPGEGDVDGGPDAVWDGTTLVIFNAHQDQLGHFVWWENLEPPVIVEGEDG